MSEGADSALPAVAPVTPREGVRSFPLASAPPLTWLAAIGCFGDLIINRVLLRTWAGTLPRQVFVELDRWGAFCRNLAVVSALVALAVCLAGFGSRRSGLPLSARVGIMGFGWALVPIVGLMTFMPLAWTRVELVMVVVGLTHALMLLVILAGIHWRSTKALSATLALLLVSYVSGVLSLVVALAGGRALWEHTERLALALRWSGELAFLFIPVAIAFALHVPWRTLRGRVALVASLFAIVAVVLSMIAWRQAVGGDLENLFYGAFRLDFLSEHGALGWYGIPLALGWAVGVLAALCGDAPQRQLGAALIILMCTGYAPRTPTALVLSALAVSLVARTALASAWSRKRHAA